MMGRLLLHSTTTVGPSNRLRQAECGHTAAAHRRGLATHPTHSPMSAGARHEGDPMSPRWPHRVRARCSCGAVVFEARVSETPPTLADCVSPRRRRSDVVCRWTADPHGVTWLTGLQLVNWYEAVPGTRKGFCTQCGTHLLNRYDFTFCSGAEERSDGTAAGSPRQEAVSVSVPARAPWMTLAGDATVLPL